MRTSTLTLTLTVIAATLTAGSCRTTEANYRSAYEKTVAGRDADDIESSIYGSERRRRTVATVATDSGTIEVTRRLVRVTDGTGARAENLKRFNIVAGQFKQLFNARSFRDRLADAGYPGAFIVETAEPYYYIIAQSFSDATAAGDALGKFSANPPITIKEPCPFILDATARSK